MTLVHPIEITSRLATVRSQADTGVVSSAIGAMALLADGRFPSGGHAHSGGFEAASSEFNVADIVGLTTFLRGRLSTTGLTEAGLVAAIVFRLRNDGVSDWFEFDTEITARIVSPTLRKVSRALGRQWLRAGDRIWPSPALTTLDQQMAHGPHQVAAFGVVASSAGLAEFDAVIVHLHHLISGPATAAVRLYGLDPYAVQRCQVELIDYAAKIAKEAISLADGPLADLPAVSGPLSDVLAEEHAHWDLRMFQS